MHELDELQCPLIPQWSFTIMLVTLVLLILFGSSAQATHVVCSWRPFASHPADFGFQRKCVSELKKEGDTHGHYFCGPNDELMIADFGYLKPNTLEWGAYHCHAALRG